MRVLTADERAVLEHVVLEPDAWWAHAQAWMPRQAEAALAAKTAKWEPSLNATKAAEPLILDVLGQVRGAPDAGLPSKLSDLRALHSQSTFGLTRVIRAINAVSAGKPGARAALDDVLDEAEVDAVYKPRAQRRDEAPGVTFGLARHPRAGRAK